MGGMWVYKCLHGKAGSINGRGVTPWQRREWILWLYPASRWRAVNIGAGWSIMGTAFSGRISIVDWILRQVTKPTESPELPFIEERCVKWEGSCEARTWGGESLR